MIDIAVSAVISDLRTNPLTVRSADGIDNVNGNDAIYNKVFPYAATPHNGRNSAHNPRIAVSPLVNISTRGMVGTGDSVLIGGFIIRGQTPVKVLVRALGPSLSAFGVPGAIADPMIDLYSGGKILSSNDDWKATQQSAIAATGFAPTNDKESGILMTLEPGAYTVIVHGKNNQTGIGLVDAFLVD